MNRLEKDVKNFMEGKYNMSDFNIRNTLTKVGISIHTYNKNTSTSKLLFKFAGPSYDIGVDFEKLLAGPGGKINADKGDIHIR